MKILEWVNFTFFGKEEVTTGDIITYTVFITVLVTMAYIKINSLI